MFENSQGHTHRSAEWLLTCQEAGTVIIFDHPNAVFIKLPDGHWRKMTKTARMNFTDSNLASDMIFGGDKWALS